MINANVLRSVFSYEMSRQQLYFKLYRKIESGLETLNNCLELKQEERQLLGFMVGSLHGLAYHDGEFKLNHTPSMLDFPVDSWEMANLKSTKKQIEEVIAFLKRH